MCQGSVQGSGEIEYNFIFKIFFILYLMYFVHYFLVYCIENFYPNC